MVGIQSKPVAPTAPATNQVLTWNGTAWAPATPPASTGPGTCPAGQFVVQDNTGNPPTCAQPAFSNLAGVASASQVPSATATTQGAVQLNGDLGGTASVPRVAGFLGIPISATAPANGQVYQYKSSSNQWVATTPASGTVTSVGLATPSEFTVSGSPLTGAGTITIAKANQSANLVFAGPTSGGAAAPTFRTMVPADLPLATATTQGSVQLAGDLGGGASLPIVTGVRGIPVSSTAPTDGQFQQYNSSLNQWIPANLPSLPAFQVNGAAASSQATINFQGGTNISVTNPSLGNISIGLSGAIPASSLPAPSATTLGGVRSYAAVSHQWLNTISTSGVPAGSQPSFGDISGAAADVQLAGAYSGVGSCPVNSFTTTLSRNGAPTCAPAVAASTALSHQFATAISAAGALSYSQPAFSDISGSVASSQLPGASNAAVGALQLAGDLGGTAAAPKVAGLQGNPVAGTAPTANQVLQWIGAAWSPASLPPTGGVGACPSKQFITAVNAGSAPTCATPVYAATAPSHQYANGMDNNGWLTYLQPSFSDISGTATPAQLPPASNAAQGTLQLVGDLNGTASTPKVAGLQGKPVSNTAPTANQVLQWSGSIWAPATLPASSGTGACATNQFETADISGAAPGCAQPAFSNISGIVSAAQLPSATASAQGTVQLAGDLAGTSAAPKVGGLQGSPVSATAPSSANQFLGWNGTLWAALQPSFSNLSGAASPTQLPAANLSSQGAVTLAGDLGGTATAPVVDGLQGKPVSSAAPATNQVLQWNGSVWTPGPLSGGGASLTAANTWTVLQTFNAGIVAQGITSTGSGTPTVQLGNSGPRWTSGSGAPTGACVVGSLYSRTDGGVASTLYVCEGPSGTWSGK